MSVVVRYKNNEEDQMTLVNNSFMKVLEHIEKCEVKSYFGYLKRIVQNEVIDDFRKEKKYKEMFSLADDENDIEVVEFETAESDYSPELLSQVMNELPAATKVVFNLFAIDKFKHKEIAEELEITVETVKWHLKTARKRLKILLREALN